MEVDVESYIDDEIRIMHEQDADPTVLSSNTFKLSIKELGLGPVLTLDISASVAEAVKLLQEKRVGSVLITKNGQLEGIVTERDLLYKVTGIISDLSKVNVSEIMTQDPVSLMKEDMIAYVMNNMHVGGYRHVPIVDENNKPIHNISIKNILRFILDHFPAAITNITGKPYRGLSKRVSE
ncbi:MAG: CBS domain-containing protein [Bacteriovoracaceae bacterium]|nr:CBS domain-containing protein [Bacteriovoracaceae bacterium]